jgi:hypothetical protein
MLAATAWLYTDRRTEAMKLDRRSLLKCAGLAPIIGAMPQL